MSDPIPHSAADATSSGQIPIELYAGPMCGLPMLVPATAETVTAHHEPTGQLHTYLPSDLTTRAGARVFQHQPEIPF